MTQFEPDNLSQVPGLAAERQRILAARGWDKDRDRIPIVRELLASHLERIYLWSYARSRNRHDAVDYARSVIVWTSRTLGEIPEECTLDAWIFKEIAIEGKYHLPLVRSELGQEPRLILSEFPNERYLVDYPETKKLLDAYREYQGLASNLPLISRSGWSSAAQDLHRFLDAIFGEEEFDHPSVSMPLTHRIARRHWSAASVAKTLLVVAGLVIIGVLFWQNRGLRSENERLETELAAINTGGTDGAGGSASSDAPPGPGQIEGATMVQAGEELRLGWKPFDGTSTYRVQILTPRMETLYHQDDVRTTGWLVGLDDLPGFDPEGSYLYRIDAMHGADSIGTTGYLPYPEM